MRGTVRTALLEAPPPHRRPPPPRTLQHPSNPPPLWQVLAVHQHAASDVAPLLGALLRFVASCVPLAEEGSPRRTPRAGDAAMADEAAADDSAAAADVAAVEEGIESLRLAPVAAQTLDVLIRSPVCEASLKRCAAELAAEAAAAEAPASPSRLGAAVPSFAQASGRLARALG